jgi:hypothetical protein
MTSKEKINRNLGLTFDFVHQLMDQPELLDKLPDKFFLEFEEKDFPKLVKKQRRSKRMKRVRVRNRFDISD